MYFHIECEIVTGIESLGQGNRQPWYSYQMVTQITLRTFQGKQVYSYVNVTIVDLNKCFKQAKLPFLLYACAPFSELPSEICTI